MQQEDLPSNDDQLRAMFEAAMDRQESNQPPPAPPAQDADPDEDEMRWGSVTGVAGKDVFVELGPREQGVASIGEFDEAPAVGARFEFTLLDIKDDLWTLSRKDARVAESWREMAVGKWVKATVKGFNKGGLEVAMGPIDGFIPISQVDVGSVEDMEVFVGQAMVCEVVRVEEARGNVVVSRRRVIEAERQEQQQEAMQTLSIGQQLEGTVARVESYGAFVEILPGVQGLLHVSNISHKRTHDASEALSVGDLVSVQVLDIDDATKRIGLGMKQLLEHPWDGAAERWPVGSTIRGTVQRVEAYGAFVELEPGVEGLLHVSQIGADRNRNIHDLLNLGQSIDVRIADADYVDHRMSLSRMDERGSLLDLDEVDPEDMPPPGATSTAGSGTNLGDLLKQAMQDTTPNEKKRP